MGSVLSHVSGLNLDVLSREGVRFYLFATLWMYLELMRMTGRNCLGLATDFVKFVTNPGGPYLVHFFAHKTLLMRA